MQEIKCNSTLNNYNKFIAHRRREEEKQKKKTQTHRDRNKMHLQLQLPVHSDHSIYGIYEIAILVYDSNASEVNRCTRFWCVKFLFHFISSFALVGDLIPSENDESMVFNCCVVVVRLCSVLCCWNGSLE